MTDKFRARPSGWIWICLALVALVVFLSATTPGRGTALTFFQSLRIAKPQPVTVNVPGFSGPAATRRLQDAVSGMIADSVRVMLDEPDQSVPNPAAASHLAGFGARLPEARRDPPTLIVLGAHAVAMSVNPSQLRTIFAESGRPNVDLPPSLNGASVTIKTPPAIRAQYGHCPVPVANTLQNQIQGPPPPSTDNGDCVVLVESPPASADVPSGLDMTQLVTIGLELSGMSPNQTQAFQRLFDWPSALSLSMPRFMRSYDSVSVDGVRGMLLNTAGRRGPTYELIWTKNAIVYSLTGYGSSADAVPLANSTN